MKQISLALLLATSLALNVNQAAAAVIFTGGSGAFFL